MAFFKSTQALILANFHTVWCPSFFLFSTHTENDDVSNRDAQGAGKPSGPVKFSGVGLCSENFTGRHGVGEKSIHPYFPEKDGTYKNTIQCVWVVCDWLILK